MTVVPIVSSRRRFYNPGEISKQDKIRLVNLDDPRPRNNKLISIEDLADKVRGKHVVVLVHGYNNPFKKVCDAYLRISNQLSNNSVPHDQKIGYIWPGGDKKLSYRAAKKRAKQLSKRVSAFLNSLTDIASSVDIVAHSMGCFLSLLGMKQSNRIRIRNIYLMAPAVGNYKLSDGLYFSNAVSKCKGVFIFKSKDDKVLRFAFFVGEKGVKALGYTGPDPFETVVQNSLTVDCSDKPEPIEHDSYSCRNEIYEFMSNNQGPITTRKETKL